MLLPFLKHFGSLVIFHSSAPRIILENLILPSLPTSANQVSPTLLAGDKSMLGTAIHEITHSWFGNDIGCQNWDNFWINEGINTFMERKVFEFLYGEDYAKIEYYVGNTSMYFDDMLSYGLDNSYSSLFPDIGDDDPENSFSGVPYDKGAQFMYWIETVLGKDAFQIFIRSYIEEFSQMAINSPMMYDFYEAWVTEQFPENATDIITMTDWDTWVYVPGVAPTLDYDTFSTTALEESIALSDAYIEPYVASGMPSTPEKYLDYWGYLPSQKAAFIQNLRNADGVDAALLEHVDNDLNITLMEKNPSVKTEWYLMGIEKGYEAVMDPCYVWLGEQGRSAFVTPTFNTLVTTGYCETALSWYDDYIFTYNSYVRDRVEKEVAPCLEEEPTEPSPTAAPVESPTAMASSAASYYLTACRVSSITAALVGLLAISI